MEYLIDDLQSLCHSGQIGYQTEKMVEYLGAQEPDSPYTYYCIVSSHRAQYDAWVGNITKESFLADIERASADYLEQAGVVLRAVDPVTALPVNVDFTLSTSLPESFYQYGVEGYPRFLMRYDEGGRLREGTADELENIQFGSQIDNFLAYNEYFACGDASSACAYSMYVVLNMVAARFKLDAAQLTGEIGFLSIAEVALLAGMREKSVRNLAHKEIGAHFSETEEKTVIPADRALAWLKGRRKFVPSQLPESDAARNALVEIAVEFF